MKTKTPIAHQVMTLVQKPDVCEAPVQVMTYVACKGQNYDLQQIIVGSTSVVAKQSEQLEQAMPEFVSGITAALGTLLRTCFESWRICFKDCVLLFFDV